MRAQRSELLSFLEQANGHLSDMATRLLADAQSQRHVGDQQWGRVRDMHEEFTALLQRMEESYSKARGRAEVAEEALDFYESRDGYKVLAKEHEQALQTIAELEDEVRRPAAC